MKLLALPVALARRAGQAFFRSDVKVQWHGMPQVRLVDRQTPDTPDPSVLAAEQAAREMVEIQIQLAEVLDELPDLRETLHDIVYLEGALRSAGISALYRMPRERLEQALEQFEGLVTNWTPSGLALLRSKMAVAVRERAGEEDGSFTPPIAGPLPSIGPHPRSARMNAAVRPRPVGCGLSTPREP